MNPGTTGTDADSSQNIMWYSKIIHYNVREKINKTEILFEKPVYEMLILTTFQFEKKTPIVVLPHCLHQEQRIDTLNQQMNGSRRW